MAFSTPIDTIITFKLISFQFHQRHFIFAAYMIMLAK
jgi:hypothetical protein